MSLADNFDRAGILVEKARAGDAGALKTLMFPLRYGMKYDEEKKKMRPYTQEEQQTYEDRILGKSPNKEQ